MSNFSILFLWVHIETPKVKIIFSGGRTMIFWIFWIIGIEITTITKGLIKKSLKPFKERYIYPQVIQLETKTKILLHLLIVVCIILVGGIAVAKFVGVFYEAPFGVQILSGIIPALLTYMVGYWILELDYFDDVRSQLCFLVVFIISILGWTILINNYNRNIEDVTEVIIEQTKKRELLYFCNVPVQKITGEVNGSSSILGGSVSGSINTTHKLTYWYANESGKGLFDTVPANSSEIEFLEEGAPYVELLNYYQCKKRVDHNTGLESVSEENRWIKYVFHLPKTIMQYTLD